MRIRRFKVGDYVIMKKSCYAYKYSGKKEKITILHEENSTYDYDTEINHCYHDYELDPAEKIIIPFGIVKFMKETS